MQTSPQNSTSMQSDLPPPVITQPQAFFDGLNFVSAHNIALKNGAKTKPQQIDIDSLPPSMRDQVMHNLRQSGLEAVSGRIPIVMSEQRRAGTLAMRGTHIDDLRDDDKRRRFYAWLEEEMRKYARYHNYTADRTIIAEIAGEEALKDLDERIEELKDQDDPTSRRELEEAKKERKGLLHFLRNILPSYREMLEQVPPVAQTSLDAINTGIDTALSGSKTFARRFGTVAKTAGRVFSRGARDTAITSAFLGNGLYRFCSTTLAPSIKHAARAFAPAIGSAAQAVGTGLSATASGLAKLILRS